MISKIDSGRVEHSNGVVHVRYTLLVTHQGRKTFVHILVSSEGHLSDPNAVENRVTSVDDEHRDTLDTEVMSCFQRLLPPLLPQSRLPLHSGSRLFTSVDGNLTLLPLQDWVNGGVLAAWTRHLSNLKDNLAGIPLIVPEEFEVTDGKLIGSSLLVQFIRWKGKSFVLKSLTPADDCFHQDTEVEVAETRSLVQGFYNELAVLSRVPPHPSIISPPLALVSTKHNLPLSNPKIFGYLLPRHTGGTLQDRITSSPPSLRLSYASQLAHALLHLHTTAKTFHGDLKYENTIFSSKESDVLILIDFEQGRTNPVAAAPEIKGGWDVSVSSSGKLQYTTYQGSTPRNYAGPQHSAGSNDWKPFIEWGAFPEAIERAEVYAFGLCAADILAGRHDPQYYHNNGGMEAYWATAERGREDGQKEIPQAVLELVAECADIDPLKRPLFQEIAEVFEKRYRHGGQERPSASLVHR